MKNIPLNFSIFLSLWAFLVLGLPHKLAADKVTLSTSSVVSKDMNALNDLCRRLSQENKAIKCQVFLDETPFTSHGMINPQAHNFVLAPADSFYSSKANSKNEIKNEINFVTQAFLEGVLLLVPQGSSINRAGELEGKKILLLDMGHKKTLSNILESRGVRSYTLGSAADRDKLMVNAHATLEADAILYTGQMDAPLLYDLLADGGYRPINIGITPALTKLFPHYRPLKLDGRIFPKYKGGEGLYVPCVVLSSMATSNYIAYALIEVFLEKVVPKYTLFESIGNKPEDYLQNPTSCFMHQAAKQFKKRLGAGGPHESVK